MLFVDFVEYRKKNIQLSFYVVHQFANYNILLIGEAESKSINIVYIIMIFQTIYIKAISINESCITFLTKIIDNDYNIYNR